MEKEEKGLFVRLLDFWKEKISSDETDGIGFWNGVAETENFFAEAGAETVLNQTEVKEVFAEKWLKENPAVLQEQREEPFRMMTEKDMEESAERRRGGTLFVSVFQKEKTEEARESTLERSLKESFLEEQKKKRMIIPVVQETERKKEFSAEKTEETMEMTEKRKEITGAEPVMDIEGLMRQITRKLWEEREGCGRRLR